MLKKLFNLIFGEEVVNKNLNRDDDLKSVNQGDWVMTINGVEIPCKGCEISRTAEYVDVRNDQSCTRQTRYLKQQDWTVTTTLKNVSLKQLKAVYGLKEDQEINNLNFQKETQEVTFKTVSPVKGHHMSYNFPKTIRGSSIDYILTKGPLSCEATFTILEDPDTGQIVEMISKATLFTKFKRNILGMKT